MSRAFVAIAAVVPALFALVAPGFATAKAKHHVTLVASGSSAAQPYMLALFSKYSKLHPTIRFSYNPDGGSAGVTDVQAGRSQFAIQTAAPVASNTGTHFYKLFLDALCVDVNSSNSTQQPVDRHGPEHLPGGRHRLVAGRGGGSGTIAPYGRNATAGLFTYFKSAVLAGRSQASNVTQLASDGLVANAVAKDNSGIGYVGLSHSTTSGQKPRPDQRRVVHGRQRPQRELPADPLGLGGAAAVAPEHPGRAVRQLGGDEQGRRQDRQSRRRGLAEAVAPGWIEQT